ncbi:receptor-type tyrosine-protein phosphatase F-like isoform X2 [Actinia tenebrosa]|uniref:protein-tyrosine-phosphatase n=1 Tax=Actinia tenebrosa TaxID=6105 RepID=A0A6P8HJF6_ACTTE|nr:receptor-type tyrosine-protein phosphatase F-like isoform X2 [Actinia tenebrosa]
MSIRSISRKAGICSADITRVMYIYVLLALFIHLGKVDADITVKADKSLAEVNVGRQVSLVWSYDTDQQPYEAVLWGKGDSRGINFEDIYFIKTPQQRTPVLDTKISPDTASRVKITNRATLVISNAKYTDRGYYICEVRSDFVTLKKKIFLEVYDPAKITNSPLALLQYKEGQKQRIVCEADGIPKPSVSWLKDGKLLKNGLKKVEIEFNPVVDTDMATYKCVAQNRGGIDESVTNITVFYKPRGTTFRTDASANTVSAGSSVNFMCKARGYPRPEYKFYIRTGSKKERKLDYRDAERSGKISNLGILDSTWHGTYICVPHNNLGEGPREEVVLYVRYAPKIIRPPRDATVNEKSFVGFRCLADGYPNPVITWIKLTGNKVLATGDSFQISSVTRQDQGKYQCRADNKFGIPAVVVFNINVLYPPIINRTISSQKVAAWVGYTAKLICYADSNPEPKYTWTNASGVVAVSEVTGVLDITPTDDSAFGDYTCEAKNPRGRDSHTITLIKVGKPGPVSLKITVSMIRSLRFGWTVLDSGQSDITHFTVQYRKVGDEQKKWKSTSLQAYETEYELKDLEPYTSYEIRVLASNQYFTSDASYITGTTLESAPTKPREVEGFPVNNSAIMVKWKEPEKKNAEKLDSYTVKYCRIQECHDLGDKMPRVSVAHNFTSIVIGRLQAFTNYSIQVIASNKAGFSKSDTTIVVTEMAAPSSPEDLSVNTSEFSVQLKWRRPRFLNGKITKFRVQLYWKLRENGKFHKEILEVPAVLSSKRVKRNRRESEVTLKPVTVEVLSLQPFRQLLVSGLRPFATYTLSASEGTGNEKNGVLWGPFSEGRVVSMPEGAPSAPKNVEAYAVGLRTLSVSWDRPAFPNGRIRQYSIVYSNSSGVNYTLNIQKDLNNPSLKYQISGLRPYTPYRIRIRAFTLYPGPFCAPVFVSTGLKSSDVARRTKEVDSGSLFGGVFAGIILFAFVVIIAVLIIRNRRRKRDSTELKGNRYGVANSNDSGIGEKESLDNMPGVKFLHGTRRGSEEVMGPGGFITLKPIPINRLADYCKLYHKNNNKLFREEFESIRPAIQSSEHSHKEDNKLKNRYQNIAAYDHSRVVLSEVDGVPTSDYINANFIDGYNCRKKSIATQGPVSNTFNDFWRMVWEHHCTTIVMVTNIIERGKVKCLKYWPSATAEEYGSLLVTPLEEEELSHYVIRKFSLSLNNNSEQPVHHVTQYHYTAWPDHGVPSHATSLLAFIRRVRALLPSNPGPVVVHCSDGSGRTGTFCAISIALERVKLDGTIDMFQTVRNLRTQRPLMVQTQEQYNFSYQVVQLFVDAYSDYANFK